MPVTSIPEDELDVLMPFRGGAILEFGNKKNATGTYRSWYMDNGATEYTSIDWNGKDGALPIDCNEGFFISPRNWAMVTNFGFSEHVSNQPMFWENVHNNCPPGGIMCGVTPAPGYWPHHGILQPTEHFYRKLAIANNYQVSKLYVNKKRKRHTVCYRLVKVSDQPFKMPEFWEDHIIPTPDPTQQALRNSGVG